jgi:hypothetical protein
VTKNAGKWAPWYNKKRLTQERYGDDDIAYQLGADWLRDLHVEDWGCGRGWFRKFIPEHLYTGIDGTASPFADIVVDLTEYRSTTEGIFLRGVLEHNDEWRTILDNALASATKRIFIAIFTPNGQGEEIGRTRELDVPDIALPWVEVERITYEAGFSIARSYTLPTKTAFQEEHFIEGER